VVEVQVGQLEVHRRDGRHHLVVDHRRQDEVVIAEGGVIQSMTTTKSMTLTLMMIQD
jgi:hypothetical protein